MGRIGRKRGGLWPVTVLMTWACLATSSRGGGAGETDPENARFRVRGLHDEVAQAVNRLLAAADRRLEQPACQEVLTDFHDASGRTLKDVLDGNEVSARGYLRWVVFSDGQGIKACGSRGTLAITKPGSRVVFICPHAFMEGARGNPDEVEATLIHEMLHSLGLGENPPSSREITARVMARCVARPPLR